MLHGAPAAVIDLTDSSAPALASQLPSDVTRLVEVPAGLLGIGVDSDGDLGRVADSQRGFHL
jgi:hypothetical protein